MLKYKKNLNGYEVTQNNNTVAYIFNNKEPIDKVIDKLNNFIDIASGTLILIVCCSVSSFTSSKYLTVIYLILSAFQFFFMISNSTGWRIYVFTS